MLQLWCLFLFFSFTDSASTEIYTLSLHDALPIYVGARRGLPLLERRDARAPGVRLRVLHRPDRKSTRLNSSHRTISYAVFCLKKKTSSTPERPTTRYPSPHQK